MNDRQNTCGACRYYLPNAQTFYRKECGYCAHSNVGRPRVTDDKACARFEKTERTRKSAASPP